MPVTARLSRRFYEQLGDEVANELVTWFNAVDDTYRSDLHAVNESNFARFDAKLEQRFAEQDARFEKRFADADLKREQVRADLTSRIERLETTMERSLKEQMRWMLLAWTTVFLAVIGTR